MDQIYESWDQELYSKAIVSNSAFNCVWKETRLDGSPVEPVTDCVAWLRRIYWKQKTHNDRNVTYTGLCDPKKGALQYSFFEYEDQPIPPTSTASTPYWSSTSTQSGISTPSSTNTRSGSLAANAPIQPRMYFEDELAMLEDLLTELKNNPMEVEMSMELVSLNEVELSQNFMDTTMMLYYSWTGSSQIFRCLF